MSALKVLMENKIAVRFMSLEGSSLSTVKRESFATLALALEAVTSYATRAGFSSVKTVEDSDGWRFTARTPNGRPGRNVAYADRDFDYVPEVK